MGNKFPFDVTAKRMMETPLPPTALPPVPVSLTGPEGILNRSLPQSLRYPYPSERWSDQLEHSQSRTQSLRAFWSAG